MHGEHGERMDLAISEKVVNDYKLTNDPLYQINLVNSIEDPN